MYTVFRGLEDLNVIEKKQLKTSGVEKTIIVQVSIHWKQICCTVTKCSSVKCKTILGLILFILFIYYGTL